MTITHHYHMTLFTLTTAGSFYEKDQAEKLKKLGFEFTEDTFPYFEDVCIKSDRVEIKIDTLDELLALAKEYGNLVIIAEEDQPTIVIYDDNLE